MLAPCDKNAANLFAFIFQFEENLLQEKPVYYAKIARIVFEAKVHWEAGEWFWI